MISPCMDMAISMEWDGMEWTPWTAFVNGLID